MQPFQAPVRSNVKRPSNSEEPRLEMLQKVCARSPSAMPAHQSSAKYRLIPEDMPVAAQRHGQRTPVGDIEQAWQRGAKHHETVDLQCGHAPAQRRPGRHSTKPVAGPAGMDFRAAATIAPRPFATRAPGRGRRREISQGPSKAGHEDQGGVDVGVSRIGGLELQIPAEAIFRAQHLGHHQHGEGVIGP